jgi:hypothetical protein
MGPCLQGMADPMLCCTVQARAVSTDVNGVLLKQQFFLQRFELCAPGCTCSYLLWTGSRACSAMLCTQCNAAAGARVPSSQQQASVKVLLGLNA